VGVQVGAHVSDFALLMARDGVFDFGGKFA
jgi:hypothetical protein